MNEAKPQVQIESSDRVFSVDISKIIEINSQGETIRELSTNDLNFTLLTPTSCANKIYNYSTILDNGAFFEIIVSFTTIIYNNNLSCL